MRKEVKHYYQDQITKEVFDSLFAICAQRNYRINGMIPYAEMNTLEDFCLENECRPEDIHVILGEDWFITYIIDDTDLEFLDWVSLENSENTLRQTLEMKKQLVNILLQAKQKQIWALMRHTTSYRFYELLKSHGYIDEDINIAIYEETTPEEVLKIVDKIYSEYRNLTFYYQDPNRIVYPELEEYIVHDATFYVNDKFFNQYQKTK